MHLRHRRSTVLLLLALAACNGDPARVNSSPTVTIVAPASGETRTEGESFTFEATASDPEDGDLSAIVRWSSDIDGTLGTGSSVTTTLSLGEHTVTAGVTDSGNETGSSTVTVESVPILQAHESCSGQSGAAVVSFSDAALESAVRDGLGVDASTALTCQMVGSLTTLSATNAAISDLTGAQNLTGLEILDLEGNQVVDLQWLSGLSGLMTLVLRSNTIVDLSPLDELESLTLLDLRDNVGIEDLSPLMNHPGLASGDTVHVEGTGAPCVETALVATGGAVVTSDCPALAPAIVFAVITPSGRDIYSMKLDGTDVQQLTDAAGDDDQPQWSPDGSTIVFASERDGNFELYSMNPDGSGQTRLTDHPWDDRWPTWSPDGSRLAFVRAGSLWTMDADGSNQADVSSGLTAAGWPDWSPDGTTLVAGAHSGTSFDIYTVELATSETTNLTATETDESHPSWSPDGTTIAFSRKDGADDVWVMGSDGSSPTKLTDLGSDNLHPDWSPGGGWIVFMSNRTGNGQIFATKADGSIVVEIGGTGQGDVEPSWR